MKPLTFLGLCAALVLAVPSDGWTRDKHSHQSHDHGHHGHGHYDYRRYPSSVYYRSYRPYYGYYGSPYPYYAGSYYSRPALGITISPRAGNYADDDLAVDVQKALSRRGYYRGSIDGDVGPGTRAAIRQYQSDRRLEVTGRIDRSLLDALDLS